MTTVAAPTRYTPEDVARLSDQTGKLYELVGGQLVEKPQVSTIANWISGRAVVLLDAAYPIRRAYVFVEQPTYCFADPDQQRRPDVAMVWAERLPGGPTADELMIAPDFVVEIVSPRNTVDDQLERVDEFLTAGVPVVWLIDPGRRWLHVYRRDGTGTILRAADTFRDEPSLPGLIVRVADLFPPVPAATQPATPGQ
jgi:Uma2 family endonuclease